MSISGKRALVTGAASGIGKEIVREFVAAGASVTAVDIDSGALTTLAAEIPGVATVAGDVSSPDDVSRAIEAADGRVDVLCNNAGLMDRMTLVDEVTPDEWARVFAVNVTGPFLFCRALLPAMAERGAGVVINVASIAGTRGGRAGAAYTASKHALVGLSRNIAVTYGAQGIRCNAICPGGIEGGARGGHTPGTALSERGAALIRGRDRLRPAGGTPTEIATVAAFLAGDGASRINGTEIVIDAGASAY
jgi:NAD(P)-dependent dehydrogenase (short-subunit alcohol dehydrogenase family)